MKKPLESNISNELKNSNCIVSKNQFRVDMACFYLDRLELTRNKFVYKTIYYQEVNKIVVQNGFLIKNRWVVRGMSFAVILSIIGLLYSVLTNKNHDQVFPLTPSSGVEADGGFGSVALMIWGPFALLIGAFLALYQSILSSTIVEIHSKGKKYNVRIRKFDKVSQTEEFLQFLINQNNRVIDKRKGAV